MKKTSRFLSVVLTALVAGVVGCPLDDEDPPVLADAAVDVPADGATDGGVTGDRPTEVADDVGAAELATGGEEVGVDVQPLAVDAPSLPEVGPSEDAADAGMIDPLPVSTFVFYRWVTNKAGKVV